MEKKLPFKLYKKIGVCPDIMRLSAILTEDKYLPWFVEQFMGLYMNCDFGTYYHDHECLERHSMYDEVLRFDSIKNFDEICVISEIKNVINNGGYLVAILDYYYIEQSKAYKNHHIVHDTLIYGFNDTSKCFYVFDGSIGESTLEYSQFLQSFNPAREIFKKVVDRGTDKDRFQYSTWFVQNLPLSVFYLKDFSREPNLERIYHLNNKFLKGAEYTNETAKKFKNKNYLLTYYTPVQENGCLELLEEYKNHSEHESINGDYIERYGTSIYKGYYDDLYNTLMKNDKGFENYDGAVVSAIGVGIDYLMKSKDMLIFRLNYLHSKNLISYDASLLEDIQKLRNKINKSLDILIKFSYVNDKRCLIDFRQEFIEIEVLDIHVLERFRKLLYDSIRIGI